MQSRAYVLLSGGIDSTTCLHIAGQEYGWENVHAISIYYGQRHKREIEQAQSICVPLDVPHKVIDLSSIIPKTMLTDSTKQVPNISYGEIEGVSPTYVPFRNGLMLSAITSIVHGVYEKIRKECDVDPHHQVYGLPLPEWAIYFGAHAEDAKNWAYPDCTNEFTGAMANAIYVGTYHAIRLHVPLQWMTKRQIIQKGQEFGVDWSKTFSCYVGGEKHCGTCPTCRSRRDGFISARVVDPTEYEHR